MTARAPLYLGVGLLIVAFAATIFALNGPSPSAATVDDESTKAARSLSARIPAGQVAIAVRLSQVEGVSGLLRSGDTIDLYAFLPERATGGSASTRVLLREKLVYSAAQDRDTASVTLAMPQEEAVLLQDAFQLGARPYAVLRSGRGMGGPQAPAAFETDALSSWIARLAANR